MRTLQIYRPGDAEPLGHPYMFYVTQKDDVIQQESQRHHCQEVLLRWAAMEYAQKGGGIKNEPYCFRPGYGHSYMSPSIQMVLSSTRLAPTMFAVALETYIHPIEQAADIMPTNVTKLDSHLVFLQADRRWAANSLVMSIWLQLIHTTLTWREKDGDWLKFLHTNSYFAQVPSAAKIKRVWEILPKLIAHKFPTWWGYPSWTPYCGVFSQIHKSESSNTLGQWMWKHCWKDGNE